MASASAQPPRALGLADVTLFMVTAGSSLQWTAVAAAAGPSSLVVWVLGALGFFLPLAVSVVFLTARHPDDGGLYAWTGRAFGPFASFMTGWTYWTGTLAFIPSVLYFAAGSARLAGADSDPAAITPAWFVGFSIAVIVLAVLLNVRGLAVARWLNSAGAVARWVGTLLLVTLAAASCWRFGSATAINARTIAPEFRLADVIFWTTLAFCFTGPEAASFMGREIRDARRTVPRALALAAPMIATIYIAGTACVLLVIPPQQASGVYGVMAAVRSAAVQLGLAWLIPLAALCVALDRIGSTCLWIGALARVPLANGVGRWLPHRFTALDARGSPSVAIWTQALIVTLLVVLGQSGTTVRGAYNVLIEMMIVCSMLPYLLLFGATIRLSGGAPADGAVRRPAARAMVVLLAIVGFVTTTGSMALAFVPPPEEPDPTLAVLKVAGLNAVLLTGGVAIYLFGRTRVSPA